MKHWAVLLLSLYMLPSVAQEYIQTPVSIIPRTTYLLNSRTNALVGGKSAVAIEIELPENTLYWYYSVSHFNSEIAAEKAEKQPDLFQKLQQVLYRKDTIGNQEHIKMGVPGNISGNTYLLSDSVSVDLLLNNLRIGKPRYSNTFSRLLKNDHVVRISSPKYSKGKQYLAITNPATLDKIYTSIEVVAIVAEEKPKENGWKYSDLEIIRAQFLEDILDCGDTTIPAYAYKNVVDCLERNTLNRMSKEQYFEMDEYEVLQWRALQLLRCASEGRNVVMEGKISPDRYFLTGTWNTEKDEQLQFQFNGKTILTKSDGKILNGTWKIHQQMLILEFSGYKTQQYTLEESSNEKLVWKNTLSGNMLRMERAF